MTKTIKTILLGTFIALFLSSCTRYFTPYQAANTGGKHCSKRNSIR